MDIIKAKIDQATKLLDEMNIDAWALFERETPMLHDPTHPMVVGINVAWNSLFLYTRRGDAIALVGNFDAPDFTASGRFTEVQAYVQGPREHMKRIFNQVNPRTLALNYSVNDPVSDGLTHGMFLLLQSYLKETPYADRIISSQEFVGKLRARKLPEEVKRLEHAAILATQAWDRAYQRIQVGMSEKQIGAIIDEEIRRTGGEPSFPTIVNAGAKTSAGHVAPTDAIIEPSELLHIDFGIKINDFCSDLQRLVYFKRPGESAPPAELQRAFDTVAMIITKTAEAALPGKQGHEIDALARQLLRDNGYPEYQHALGHQLGRDVHDGGGILGPQWERYGNTPNIPLEASNVFTLELEIILDGIGCVGLEEDTVITPTGARYLCERQTALLAK